MAPAAGPTLISSGSLMGVGLSMMEEDRMVAEEDEEEGFDVVEVGGQVLYLEDENVSLVRVSKCAARKLETKGVLLYHIC